MCRLACSFERWTGRVEHLAGTLRKSVTDTFDRISRGHGVEGHEHVNCEWRPPGRAPGCKAVLTPFHSTTTTDSVETISGGPAESPSAVLMTPIPSPKDADGCL